MVPGPQVTSATLLRRPPFLIEFPGAFVKAKVWVLALVALRALDLPCHIPAQTLLPVPHVLRRVFTCSV